MSRWRASKAVAIESVFATVRHRTVRTEGALSPTTARLTVFKLVIAASKTSPRLKGTNQLPKLIVCQIQRQHRGHPRAGKPRRLITSSPTIPDSSFCVFPAMKSTNNRLD